ncbi:manganese catalase family protein [Desulfosporosinus sp. Sb-LF]|uniref:manganese catalase family protein n=1 Tax=Desulfosporosinus sp. Sb-LF TaxID=2560027 RepID=UPI00107F720A|nr:manganese catalase family protein [Desulfosporosinus sp. Sb-LF]TGE33673.1 Mn-containing catalase [Desulfosporosinus sp. Sb-LF]
MYNYRKRLFYPVHVKGPDPVFAKVLFEHYAGRNGELSSSLQYLNHYANFTNRYVRELLGLIAAEELGHMELISVAIIKLGGPPLTYANSQGAPWVVNYINQSADPIDILQVDVEAETRASHLYRQHLELTSDPNMKKMIGFLISREEVHKRLLQRAQTLIREFGSPEEFNRLIYDYKMSLQVLE